MTERPSHDSSSGIVPPVSPSEALPDDEPTLLGTIRAKAKAPSSGELPVLERELPTIPDFEVLDEIGYGAMGVVYRARHRRSNRLVALKILTANSCRDEGYLRFLSEAEATARLNHPNIVHVVDAGDHGGQPYLALELVEGGSLRDRLYSEDDDKLPKSPLPIDESVRLVEKIARAISHAHAHGIVHRDLKPSNILLTPEGEPLLSDFGIAKLLNSEHGWTRTGAIVGTPTYMAPEQAQGETHQIGPAADIYSLGVLLYELLTTRRPIEGDATLETLHRVAREEPIPLRRWNADLPRDLEAICSKCLEKEPHRRYSSADALATDLERFRLHEPIEARRIGVLGRAVRWCRRKPLPASLALLVMLFVVSLVVATPFVFLLYREAEQSRAFAERAARQAEANHDAADQARRQADLEKQKALAQELEAEEQLVRLHALTGVRLLESDPFESLVWTTEARRLLGKLKERHPRASLDDPALEYRTRSLLSRTTRLVREVETPSWAEFLTLDPENQALVLQSVERDFSQRKSIVGGRLDSEFALQSAEFRASNRPATFSRDGRWALRVEHDRFDLWDVRSNRVRVALERPALCSARFLNIVRVSESGRYVFAWWRGSTDEERAMVLPTVVWDVRTGKILNRIDWMHGVGRGNLEFAFFSESENRLIFGTRTFLLAIEIPTCKVTRVVHDRNFRSAACSPNGRWLAYDLRDHRIELLDLESGETHQYSDSPRHDGPIVHIAIDPTGSRLLTCSEDNTARVWRLLNGKPISNSLVHDGGVLDGAFSPDGRWVLTRSESGSVRVWDTRTSQPISSVLRHSGPILGACWLPSGRRVATLGENHTLRMWDLATRRLEKTLAHSSPLTQVRFGPRGNVLLTGTKEGTVRRWAVSNWKPIGSPLRHDGPVALVELEEPVEDGSRPRRILTLSEKALRLWDSSTSEPTTAAFGAHLGNLAGVHHAALLPGTDSVVLCYADRLNVFDTKQGVDVRSFHNKRFLLTKRLLWFADESILVCGDHGHRVVGRDLRSGKELWHLQFEDKLLGIARIEGERRALVLHRSGLSMVEVMGGTRTRSEVTFPRSVRWAHIQVDRGSVVLVTRQNGCQVRDCRTGEPLGPAIHPGGTVRFAAVTSHGHLVTVLSTGSVRLWEIRSGEPITGVWIQGNPVTSVDLSPDGRLLAVGDRSGQVRIWDLEEPRLANPDLEYRLARWLAGKSSREELGDSAKTYFDEPVGLSVRWHRTLADECRLARDPRAELFHLDRLLAVEPKELVWKSRQLRALIALKRFEEALAPVTECLEREQRNVELLRSRTDIYLGLKRWGEALSSLEELAKVSNEPAPLWLEKSLLCLRIGKQAEADSAYRKALGASLGFDMDIVSQRRRSDPRTRFEVRTRWKPLLDRRSSYFPGGWKDQANSEWESGWHRAVGLVRLLLGEVDSSRAEFELALARREDDPEAWRGLALCRAEKGQADEALLAVDKALESSKKDGTLWYLRARFEMSCGRMDSAFEALGKAIENGYDTEDARRYRGFVCLRLRRYPEAIADLTESLDLGGKRDSLTWSLRGACFLATRRWKLAARDFGEASKLATFDAAYLRASVLLHLHENEAKEAGVVLNRALEQAPATAQNDLALIESILWVVVFHPEPQHLDHWLEYFESHPEKNDPTSRAATTYAGVLLRMGRYREASDVLDSVLTGPKAKPDAWRHLLAGLVHHRLGNNKEARQELGKAQAWVRKQQTGKLSDPRFARPLSWEDAVSLAVLFRELESALRVTK